MIYTSGSTGRPKGVLVPHGNVVPALRRHRALVRVRPERDVWTLFHSYAFDFSVWEIWGALLYGGRLVVVPWEVSRSPERFLDLLAARAGDGPQPDPLGLPPARAGRRGSSAPRGLALRLVIFGGEALDPASLAPWFARHGDTAPRLVNMYGITETTVHVTYRPLSAPTTRTSGAAAARSAGRSPTSRSTCWTGSSQPVPIGVPGEIYVGGAGLARGYLDRPELTAERFVPDPFGGRPGARLYRTGDLARCLPDGELEYLGRLDHQVKIRGFRIELGEIEAALAAAPRRSARRSCWRARTRPAAETRLVAYVVGRGRSGSGGAARASSRERLPEYMVPAPS